MVVRNALGSIYVIKGGEQFSQSRFWDGKVTKMEDFLFPKNSKIDAKIAQKKVSKKLIKKITFINIFK